eukprot:1157096-Pelagomonas_calceolata.AAC.7
MRKQAQPSKTQPNKFNVKQSSPEASILQVGEAHVLPSYIWVTTSRLYLPFINVDMEVSLHNKREQSQSLVRHQLHTVNSQFKRSQQIQTYGVGGKAFTCCKQMKKRRTGVSSAREVGNQR